jgi:hypothetical protein
VGGRSAPSRGQIPSSQGPPRDANPSQGSGVFRARTTGWKQT